MKSVALWEALDGKRFKDKESCLIYEMRINGVYLFDPSFNSVANIWDAEYLYIKDMNGVKYVNNSEEMNITVDSCGCYLKVLNKFRKFESRLDEFYKLRDNVDSKINELCRIKESVENSPYICV